jgi:hypothetical protein
MGFWSRGTVRILEEFMNESIESGAKLDGTWANGVFKLIIKGNTYVSLYNGSLYGKGTILYDNENFTITSTHARWLFFYGFLLLKE